MSADLTCAEVQAEIRAGAVSSGARAHAAGCPACAQLLADDAALGKVLAAAPGPGPADDALADAILGRIEAERNPLPRVPAWVRAALVWAAIAAPGLAFLVAKPRPDLSGSTLLPWLAAAGAWVLAGGVGARVALRPVHRAAVASPGAWIALSLALPLAIGLGATADVGTFLGPAAHCFSRGAATAVVVLALLRGTDRRSRPTPAWWAGASGLAAVAGGLMLHASCDLTGVAHLLAAHASIGAALALVAAGIARLRPTGP
jgi:hypothetical protein